jgi:putative ABC transport system substrate-binding protein
MASKKVGFFHVGTMGPFQKHFSAFSDRLLAARSDAQIDHRWADGQPARTVQDLNDLVAQDVAVIVAAGGPQSALAAKTATQSKPIPVVFTSVADPVGLGLVKSLAQPGTNMTGIAGLTSELDVARLQLLYELLGGGGGATVGVLNNPTRPQFKAESEKLKTAASRMKLNLVPKEAADLDGIKKAFAEFKGGQQIAGLLVTADSLFNNHRKEVVTLAAGMPAIYQWREFADVGGFMSFGPSIIEAYELVADYAAKILDNTKPSDLPVALPTRFELVINIDVALAGGFNIPASLLSRAEFVRTTA